jgi:hypothetical protein
MEQPLQGLVDVSNDAYHSGPGISKSHLDWIAPEMGRTPLHYWNRYINPDREPDKQTPAKVLGTAIHTAILEPDLLSDRVVPGLDIDRRSNANRQAWADFEKANAGKIILPGDAYQTVLAIRDAVHRHPVAGPLLQGIKTEQSFYATDKETGELIKCRFDALADSGEYALDLKSTENAGPAAFGRSAANYRYHLQPPWYFDILRDLYGETPKYWMFLAVEKEPPHAIGIYYAQDEDIEFGRKIARRDLRRIVECKQQDYWPDYAAQAMPLQLPAWYTHQAENAEMA